MNIPDTPFIPDKKFFLSLLYLSLSLFALCGLSQADEWTQVASGGFGIPDQGQPDAMIIHNSQIYVATSITLPGGTKQPKIYRADMRDDTVWTEFSPPWSVNGEVTDMTIFQNRLFVSNSAGQIWRLAAAWAEVTPAWPGDNAVLSMHPILPASGGHRLCAVREGIDMWCGTPGTGGTVWTEMPVPTGFDSDPSIQNVRLRSMGRDLYLGVGGASAGSRMCELWKLDTPPVFTASVTWDPVTEDCFGFGDDLTWISSMAEYNAEMYIGTAGHGATAVVYKTDGTMLEDVTPCTLYADCSPFALPPLLAPIRYGAMAVAANMLYVGTRTPSLPGESMGADVLVLNGAGEWANSNEPGFGVVGNDTVTALASGRGYIYAAVLNLINGLEVWRKTPLLINLFPFLEENLRNMIRFRAELKPCIIIPGPSCPYNLDPMFAELEFIGVAFERAFFEDASLLSESAKNIAEAEIELQTAQQLASQALKEPKPGVSQKLLAESFMHVNQSVKITQSTLQQIKNAIQ